MMEDVELVAATDLERLGILKRGTAFRMAKAGAIPSYSVGVNNRGVRFRVSEVLAALRGKSTYVGDAGDGIKIAPVDIEGLQMEKEMEEPSPCVKNGVRASKNVLEGDTKNIFIRNGKIFVRLFAETKQMVFGEFDNISDARDFRDKCHREMKMFRFFPERYRKVGTISAIPVVALRSHWVSQRREFLEWQRMKLQLKRVREELLRATRQN